MDRVLLALVLAAVTGLDASARGQAQSAQTYHVDDQAGDDASDGQSPATAWRSLDQVNRAEVKPGDRVRFRRGGVWRGQLVPRSGAQSAPVTYGAYGDGPRPVLLGSTSRNLPEDWVSAGPGLWRTAAVVYRPTAAPTPLPRERWSLHVEAPARATCAADSLRIACDASGDTRSRVQLSASSLSLRAGRHYQLSMQARCDRDTRPITAILMQRTPPWTPYTEPAMCQVAAGAEWSSVSLVFRAQGDASAARLTLFLGDALAAGSVLEIAEAAIVEVAPSQPIALDSDVGNILFDDAALIGFKKWEAADLEAEYDYVYEPATQSVLLRCERNPASKHNSIELALRRHIIDETARSFVTYEDLHLRYGAAHGIGGGSTRGITVRRCDISYIGGGHHRPNEGRVRYGNGIEFWENARDCLVEDCRIWEIYDAALTNQGGHQNVQENITYRRNVIWNAEYSFEYWNRESDSVTRAIRFEHNTCVDAGGGWGHRQRPNPNGRHLMFYRNTAATSDFVVRGNIFANATDGIMRYSQPEWADALIMDANCWYQPRGEAIQWVDERILAAGMAAFLHERGFENRGVFANPRFVDPTAGHYIPSLEGPAAQMGATAGRE